MITIRNIHLKNGQKSILNIDEITLEPRKKYIVLGGNGTGKTLLLKQIHTKKRENLIFDATYSGKTRIKTVLIEHEPALISEKTVWQNLIFGVPKLNDTKKLEIKSIAEKIELSSYLDESVERICFSNKKLVEIVRAIAISPSLLLIDDLNKYFDDISFIKGVGLLQFAATRGSIVLCSSSEVLVGFENSFVIQDGILISNNPS